MIRFVFHKIKNKKWLNLCLLAGISLLAAVFACCPMFEKGAEDALLWNAFLDYAAEQEEFPAVFSREGSYDIKKYPTVQSVCDRLNAYEAKWLEYVDIDKVVSQQYLKLNGDNIESSLDATNLYLNIGFLQGLEEHTTVVKGKGLDDSGTDNGAFPCLISESVMDATGLVTGEEITFPYCLNIKGEPARFVVTGIIREASYQDNYWYHDLSYYEKQIFVSEETFDLLMQEYGFETLKYEESLLVDYTGITSDNALDYLGYIEEFIAADSAFSTNLLTTLQYYETQRQTVRMILWVLELPCVVLLLLFIYMISSQVLGAEEGEIAVLRSRGATKGQTMLLYVLQSLLLSAAGMILGMGLGFLMCKCAASTDGFLHFVQKDVSLYTFHWKMPLYALAACAIAMLFMTFPVWKRAGITIVEQKSGREKTSAKPFWEKYFLDVLLLILSCYLLYNHNKQSGEMILRIIAGESLDPMIFLNASLFLFSCGLVFLRFTRYLVLLVDRLGKKRWKPELYASFLQITRTFRKQSFISVFLIMTIANGIFDANMARSMNANNEERIAYHIGTDVQLMEKWKLHTYRYTTDEPVWYYDEPNFQIYEELVDQGICDSVTRVLEDDNTEVASKGTVLSKCKLMGISTKEFGETAELLEGLNDTHWFNALNALAENADGVIISGNVAEKLDLKVGSTLTYKRFNPLDAAKPLSEVKATVCAIVDCFPGYEQYSYVTDKEKNISEQENYLIVGNYATILNEFELTPCRVWMRLSEDAAPRQVQEFLEEREIVVSELVFTEEEIEESRSSALIQITNGMFTMTFFISILICSAGFLIYWIMSIQSRELIFGIYRAMGMRMREIRRMLINEHIFGSLLPILAGGVTGSLGTLLFVKLITLVYLPEKHNIAIRISVHGADMGKLFLVVFAVVLVCFFVLRKLLQRMKIAQALKLGED